MTVTSRLVGRVALLLGVLAVLAPVPAWAKTYQVAKGSEVSFFAKITASSFVAKSTALGGTVDLDAAAGKLLGGRITVKANSFATGMDGRDEEMRDKYLKSAKFPDIALHIQPGPVTVKPKKASFVKGYFVIKDRRRPVKIPVMVMSQKGDDFVVGSSFKLDISHYGIPQPSFMVVKMETVIKVRVKLVLKAK